MSGFVDRLLSRGSGVQPRDPSPATGTALAPGTATPAPAPLGLDRGWERVAALDGAVDSPSTATRASDHVAPAVQATTVSTTPPAATQITSGRATPPAAVIASAPAQRQPAAAAEAAGSASTTPPAHPAPTPARAIDTAGLRDTRTTVGGARPEPFIVAKPTSDASAAVKQWLDPVGADADRQARPLATMEATPGMPRPAVAAPAVDAAATDPAGRPTAAPAPVAIAAPAVAARSHQASPIAPDSERVVPARATGEPSRFPAAPRAATTTDPAPAPAAAPAPTIEIGTIEVRIDPPAAPHPATPAALHGTARSFGAAPGFDEFAAIRSYAR